MEFGRAVATSGSMDSTHILQLEGLWILLEEGFFVVPEGLFSPAVDLWNLSYRVPWLCTRDQVSKARVGRDVTESSCGRVGICCSYSGSVLPLYAALECIYGYCELKQAYGCCVLC